VSNQSGAVHCFTIIDQIWCNVTSDQDPGTTSYELNLQNKELGLKVDKAGEPKVECVVSLQSV